MKLDPARLLALLLALTLATASVAQAQQYPFAATNYADGETDDPPPPLEDGAVEDAPPAPGAGQPGVGQPAAAQPGPALQGTGQAGDPAWMAAPGMPGPAVDGYVGGDMLCAQQCGYGSPDGCCQDGCCNGCCNDCDGCDLGCCDCCAPCYCYARVDAIFMTRSNSRGQPIATLGSGGPVVLSTRDLSFRWEPVERFLIGVPVHDDTVIELSYMGLQTWQTQRSFVSPVNNAGAFTPLRSPFSNFGGNALTGADINTVRADIGYNSTLHNAEFNFVHCLKSNANGNRRIELIHGVRWIEILERFDYSTFSLAGLAQTSSSRVRTFNDLVGYQLGCRMEFNLRPRLHLLLESKAGLYGNWMTQRTNIVIGAAGTINEVAQRSELAFAADATLSLSYDLASWFSVRVGYTAMNVTGVALAPENFAGLPVPLGAVPRVPVVNVGGNILYQGASVGFEARF